MGDLPQIIKIFFKIDTEEYREGKGEKRTSVSEWKELKTKNRLALEYTRYLLYNGSASFLLSKLNRVRRHS